MAKKRCECMILPSYYDRKESTNKAVMSGITTGQAIRVREMAKLSKKFMRYSEAAVYYSIGKTKLQALAKEAHAVYKVDNVALINCEVFERFLETFRL